MDRDGVRAVDVQHPDLGHPPVTSWSDQRHKVVVHTDSSHRVARGVQHVGVGPLRPPWGHLRHAAHGAVPTPLPRSACRNPRAASRANPTSSRETHALEWTRTTTGRGAHKALDLVQARKMLTGACRSSEEHAFADTSDPSGATDVATVSPRRGGRPDLPEHLDVAPDPVGAGEAPVGGEQRCLEDLGECDVGGVVGGEVVP